MRNTTATRSNLTHLRSFEYIVDVNGCNVIPAGNSSLAANWENIPETLLLNAVIGAILFSIFLILTRIAWRRVDNHDELKDQNIVTFLYGYRDPEQWYIIPRFEFLRREERHHQHDLNYPHLYAPPKLPLANPLEILANNDDIEHSKSAESSQANKPTIDLLKPFETHTNGSPKAASKHLHIHDKKLRSKSKTSSKSPQSPASLIHQASSDSGARSPPQSDTSLTGTTSTSQPNRSNTDRRETLKSGPSFFYPSILTAEQLQASSLSRKLNKFFSIFFRVADADLIYARGIDAYEYLLFQRHLILILFITNVLCLGVLLPINWFGGARANANVLVTSFQRSTIKNITPESADLHWAHLLSSGIIVLCSLKIMGSYRDSIISPKDQQISRRTLLIGNIPIEQRSRAHLLRIFSETFPSLTIEAIQFVYDTAKLYDDEMYLSSTIVAKEYCLAFKRKHKREIYVRRTDVNSGRVCDGYCRCCSFFYICCCHWPCESREPGSIYYTKEEEFYREKIAKNCEKLVKEPAEFAFVTFKSHKQAKKVMQELSNMKQDILEGRGLQFGPKSDENFNPMGSRRRPARKAIASNATEGANDDSNDPLDPKNDPHVRSIRSPRISRLKQLEKASTTARVSTQPESNGWHSHIGDGPLMWSVRYAPHPDNVEFDDLLNLSRTSPVTIVILHTVMIIIFIFITTPNVVLSMIERISIIRPEKAAQLTGFQRLALNYISILLQIITTALLPALITLISRQIPYEDSSSKGHSVMWKVYLFLVLMVIVMPSIGMSSALAFFDSAVDPKCLFPTDNGAYYINYVISSIFLSTMLELIKPVDVISYYFILWTSRSTAEIESGRQFIEREFSVGLQHTGVLLIFSVVMTYSISCPLIAPVGLLYMIIKHSVDHYNLYYTYFTKKVDKDMQNTIVIFVRVALLLMLFQTSVAIYISTGSGYFSIIAYVIFGITLLGFIFGCFYDCTSRSSPPSNKRAKYQHDFCACFYLPKVISSLLRLAAIPASCISRKV